MIHARGNIPYKTLPLITLLQIALLGNAAALLKALLETHEGNAEQFLHQHLFI